MAFVPRFFQPPTGHYYLFGPRGTGKSTWLRRTYSDALWLDLLAPDVERSLAARPERLRERVAGASEARVVVIDEVQRVPQLLPVVHQLIEERARPSFVLTGSSARKLKRTGVDLLAGRAVLRSLRAFGEDYPQAKLRLVYRGEETLEIDGVRCLPCNEFLRSLRPGRSLP